MLINEKPFLHWLTHFYGYGAWQAKVWFVGYEEGGGDLPEEVAAKINYFLDAHGAATAPELCDMREVYRHVPFFSDGPKADKFTNRHDYRFGNQAVLHGVWKNLISFEHGYRNEKLPDLLAYQKNSFAVASAQRQALVQLYPLPSPHNHAWYYSWLDLPQFPFLKSRVLYEKHVYDYRIKNILQQVVTHKPEVVLMYGMNNINALKLSVQEFFPDAKFKMIKAVKLHIPQHHLADLGETKLIVTTQIPALRHGRVETGFDWEAFGKSLR
ncbi:hypothetical protein [Chryseolinea lacunae]|uniref:Uracil-DNA glycosylase-like domain-containing protein n=1 Tax=Chryseolinea lacunae TaxID=2801331 RepID=A0ABS1KYD5_9BACT|nr:hypothetical protein [Chryseolinea lacunae]MBL0744464.1 hypothetical protein [Chryseolinea lacunae]